MARTNRIPRQYDGVVDNISPGRQISRDKSALDVKVLGRKSALLRVLALVILISSSWLLVMVCVLLPISLLVVNAIDATGRI